MRHIQPWWGGDLRVPGVVILAVLLGLRHMKKLILYTQLLLDSYNLRHSGIITRYGSGTRSETSLNQTADRFAIAMAGSAHTCSSDDIDDLSIISLQRSSSIDTTATG